jgi:anti-sigma regulatory factor (Ser/Thr protein kinase)
VTAARHWARDELAAVCPSAVVADAELCISELATNAVEHANTAYEVRLRETGGWLHISVVDDDVGVDPYEMQPSVPSPEANAGRGLLIVAALAGRYGTTREGDRKVVWCALAIA